MKKHNVFVSLVNAAGRCLPLEGTQFHPLPTFPLGPILLILPGFIIVPSLGEQALRTPESKNLVNMGETLPLDCAHTRFREAMGAIAPLPSWTHMENNTNPVRCDAGLTEQGNSADHEFR